MNSKNSWTTRQRYRPYDEWPTEWVVRLDEKIADSRWRLGYHIQPQRGLLNDPNGFSYYNGKWHLFYQAYPMGPVHGIKSWYHLTSENLVDWQEEGLKLLPDSPYDSHGVYSGSAVPVGEELFLAYTGNVRDKDWQRHSYQLGAWMDQNGTVSKLSTPLLTAPPAGYTQEFRDPQVFACDEGYLMVIGAQDQQENGQILTYFSQDLTTWELRGELDFTSERMGFMVECPNLLFSKEQPLLLFCPQGLDPAVCNYQNIYPNSYVIGSRYDPAANRITAASQLKNLDEGFDVYATQGFNAPDGRILAVSWIGLPEIDYPSDAEGWAHCLSLVKELTLEADGLHQRPARETTQLRSDTKTSLQGDSLLLDTVHNRYELQLEIPTDSHGSLLLFADNAKKNGFRLTFDTVHGRIELDRSAAGIPFAEAFGTTRSFSVAKGALQLQIFVDTSVAELFINDGRQTATARIFPEVDQRFLAVTCDKPVTGELWHLRTMR